LFCFFKNGSCNDLDAGWEGRKGFPGPHLLAQNPAQGGGVGHLLRTEDPDGAHLKAVLWVTHADPCRGPQAVYNNGEVSYMEHVYARLDLFKKLGMI
jgi:hypothetical protein